MLAERKLDWFEFEKLFEDVKKYGIAATNESGNIIIHAGEISAIDKGTDKHIFYDNIHISYHKDEKNTILRIKLKSPNEEWVGTDENVTNEEYQVYVKFDVDVLGETRCTCEKYASGNWDSYIYHTLNAIEHKLSEMTEYEKFQKVYAK